MKPQEAFQKWLPFTLVGLPFLLIALSLLFFLSKKSSLEDLDRRLDYALEKAFKMRKKEEVNEIVKGHFSNVDSAFLSREIESQSLLSAEQSALQKKLSLQLPGGEKLAERLAFLKRENRMSFVEKSGERKDGIQESLHVLEKPVEVDEADLKKITEHLEKREKNDPLIIITELSIKRKRALGKSEVFGLNLELLKREFLQS